MAYEFGERVFTPAVKALQEKYGSRQLYARVERSAAEGDRLGPLEQEFVSGRDSFYVASVGASGWPYVQHRGGPKGFVRVIDEHTLAFADFRGNKQYVTTGNVTTDDRVAMIAVDYPQQVRLKILGRAEVLEGDAAAAWVERVRTDGYKAKIERVFVIHVEAFDWNCRQHITPRFTEAEVREVLTPVAARLKELEDDNARLRGEVARLTRG